MSRSCLDLASCNKRLVSVSSRVTYLNVSVSLICKRSKPLSNFVQFVQKQTFYEHRYMPVPSNTACCIYDKCVTNGSLTYMWHLKRNKIHLHIIRLFSSFTVFRKLSLYESQHSHTHMITLWLLYYNIFTHIQ